MEPYDIAPVLKRLTISVQGSTSSNGTGLSQALKSMSPRSNPSVRFWASTPAEKSCQLFQSSWKIAWRKRASMSGLY